MRVLINVSCSSPPIMSWKKIDNAGKVPAHPGCLASRAIKWLANSTNFVTFLVRC